MFNAEEKGLNITFNTEQKERHITFNTEKKERNTKFNEKKNQCQQLLHIRYSTLPCQYSVDMVEHFPR